MVAIQEISARIGRVTGHGIAGNVCRNFQRTGHLVGGVVVFRRKYDQHRRRPRRDGRFARLLIGGPAFSMWLCSLRFRARADLSSVQSLCCDPEMADAYAFCLCHRARRGTSALGRGDSRGWYCRACNGTARF